MYSCDHLTHPFINDPGTSQDDRLPALFTDGVPLDGREISDLLNYFSALAGQINFYNNDLTVADWTPFFKNSLPFLLSAIAAYPSGTSTANRTKAIQDFQQEPSPEGLRLIFLQSYYTAIYPLQQWSVSLQNSGHPLETTLQLLIADRLTATIKSFVTWLNTAVKYFGIRSLDLQDLVNNAVWGLSDADLTSYEASFFDNTMSLRHHLLTVQAAVSPLADQIAQVAALAAEGAADSVNEDLYSLLQSSGQADIPPHQALLFSFLNQYLHVMDDLNGLTQKHLDFFFKQVLALAPGDLQPDKAYVTFTIQKQTPAHAIDAGTLLKDGKDNLQGDIYFSLDDDVTITQTRIGSVKTLFVNKKQYNTREYVEGVYAAPDATKADGVSTAFKDPATAAWPTMGGDQYPIARLGFALASKVLFLQEGKRYVHIRLACHWEIPPPPKTDPQTPAPPEPQFTSYFKSAMDFVGRKFLIIDQELLDKAATLGISADNITQLKNHFLTDHCTKSLCGDKTIHYLDQFLIPLPACNARINDTQRWTDEQLSSKSISKTKPAGPPCPDEKMDASCQSEQDNYISNQLEKLTWLSPTELAIFRQLLVPQQVFNIQFSGLKNWIIPEQLDMELVMTDVTNNNFLWHIGAHIGADQDPIGFYNGDVLGDFPGKLDPLVTIVLNDKIKFDLDKLPAFPASSEPPAGPTSPTGTTPVIAAAPASTSSQSLATAAASPTPPAAPASTAADTAQPAPLSTSTPPRPSCLLVKEDPCGQKVSLYDFFRYITIQPGDANQTTAIVVQVCGVKDLIVQNDDNLLDKNKAFAPFGVKPIISDFDVYPLAKPNPEKDLNLIGPSFYIGSREIFLKKWDCLSINVNWLGKPSDFNTHYAAYLETKEPPDLDNPGYQVNLALLNNGNWYQEKRTDFTIMTKLTKTRTDYNRKLFNETIYRSFTSCCANEYQYSYLVIPEFNGLKSLQFDKAFAPLTQYAASTKNGFIRMTLEYQDFIHRIYPWVLANQITNGSKSQASYRILSKPPKPSTPNEPWTPMIQKDMSIDYSATATIGDISLLRMLPFAGTYETADIRFNPSPFHDFDMEGNLYIGLTGLLPGETLNLLFQLAEATADTEEPPAEPVWQYLAGNQWKPLRDGFEIISDATKNLTITGIIQFAVPNDIDTNHTILPAGSYWIRATLPENTPGLSQTSGIIPQAALATFVYKKGINDPMRPATPLAAGKLTKLANPDPQVIKVEQPFDSFGGQAPESAGSPFYLRVSEQLRHKGRAIQKWDYERMALQQFPKLLRAKCINHTTWLNSHQYSMDFPMSPGNILLAVLPDINQLKVADHAMPTVPVSMLDDMADYFSTRISTFVNLYIKNPRYEPVDICVDVLFGYGKDVQLYSATLQSDIQSYLAPWLDGDTSGFLFAQPLYMSDLISFIESRDYIASLNDVKMSHQGATPSATAAVVNPRTPRSILVAGRIDIQGTAATAESASFWKKRLKK